MTPPLTPKPSSNESDTLNKQNRWSEMNTSSDGHHGINVADEARSSSMQVNVNEDQNQNQLTPVNEKASKHKIDLRRAKSKLHSFRIRVWSMKSPVEHHPHFRLSEAASTGDWKTAEEVEEDNPGALSEVISKNRQETALHIATRFKNAAFVEKLVELLDPHDLASKNRYGNTALCIAATSDDAVDIAHSMVSKREDLVLIGGYRNEIPLSIASRCNNKKMVSYLLDVTPVDELEVDQQMELLLDAISADNYDIALAILEKNNSLALERDKDGETPLHIMATKPNAIGTKNKPTKWQSCINTWFKCMYKKTMMQIQARQMVEQMWETVVREIPKESLADFIDSLMLYHAIRVGNIEFLRVLLQSDPGLISEVAEKWLTLVCIAVVNRQERVLRLFYELGIFNSDDLLCYLHEDFNLLELAAKKAEPRHLGRVSGAVFQMHRELLWFKEVENIVGLTMRVKKGEKTPREIFTEEHKDLVEEGDKWAKTTANSCMLVATLIATVAFAAAFTVPGGNDSNTGTPIFLHNKWFMVLVISNAIALISSSTSILLFFSILTSRCVEEDFVFWLPLELALGLGSLFVSVLGMVLAFSATFFLYYGKNASPWLPWLITGMAVVPIYWFGVLQWRLWADALSALHATGMSYLLKNRKTKYYSDDDTDH